MAVEVEYDHRAYTIPRRSLTEVQAEIDAILLSGLPAWIQVFDGHGGQVSTHLLITPGVCVALAEVAA